MTDFKSSLRRLVGDFTAKLEQSNPAKWFRLFWPKETEMGKKLKELRQQEKQIIKDKFTRKEEFLRPTWGTGSDQVFSAEDKTEGIVSPTTTATPTPTPMPTATPTPTSLRSFISTITPTSTPTPIQPPAPTTTITPTPIPGHIVDIPYEKRPYQKEIIAVWGDESNVANDILRYVDEKGVVRGENPRYETGEKMDIPNRLDENGEYDPNAPIATFVNKFSGKIENNIDRGLFRINNIRFYDLLGGKVERQMMYERGIIPEPHLNWEGLTPEKVKEYWDSMLEVDKNIKMAKLIYDIWKESWHAASPTSGARIR